VNDARDRPEGVARRHHYVPAFLLQGFTPSGHRDDFLWVHDQEQAKTWKSRPDQVGFERDYYRVDLAEVDPNAIEAALAQTEGRISPIVAEVIASHDLPTREAFEALIEFVTLLALRTPYMRNLYESNMTYISKEGVKFFLSSPKLFDQFVEEQRREGNELPPEITREKLLAFAADDDAYKVKIPQTESVQMLLKVWPSLVPVFQARQWSLLFTKPDEACLICSDMPVAITPTSPDLKPPYLGFGLQGTELTVPLGRSTVLVGSYDIPSITAEIGLDKVRQINRRTRSFAERFLYSPEKGLVI
jgi:hypothetical protein